MLAKINFATGGHMISRRGITYLLFTLACANAALAQGEIQFGAPTKASPAPPPEQSLPLSTAQPLRESAQGAEVLLISGYQPTGGAVHVNVHRPGSKVLLVMTSYEKVHWIVSASKGTEISGILVSGYYPPTVSTALETQGFIAKLPYAYEADNAEFKKLLVQLNSFFGVDHVDAFRGSYSIPSAVSISTLDPPRSELTLQGPIPKEAKRNVTFDLLASDYRKVRWSLTGPVGQVGSSILGEGKIAVSDSGKTIYKLGSRHLELVDSATGQSIAAELPPNFPIFSWPMDVAYDSNQDIISVVTLGGEGFLYRFDAKQQRWIDFRSLNNVDIQSLSFDKKGNRYVAWTDRGDLIFISGDGVALLSKKVISRLEGFGRLYDRGNGRPPRIQIAPEGDDIALVYISGNTVNSIWHYDLKTDTAILTYAQK